jgi:hypothetical protein
VYPEAEYQANGFGSRGYPAQDQAGQADPGAQYAQPQPTAGYPAGTGAPGPLSAPVDGPAQQGERYPLAYREQPAYGDPAGYPEAAGASPYPNGAGTGAYPANGYGADGQQGTGAYQASGYDSGGAAYPANGYADGAANGYQANGGGTGGYPAASGSPYPSAPQPTFTPTFTPNPGYPNGPAYDSGGYAPANGAGYAGAPGYGEQAPYAEQGYGEQGYAEQGYAEQGYAEQGYGDNGYAAGYADGQQSAAYQAGPTFTPAGQAAQAQRGYWDGDPQVGRDSREQRYGQRR